MKDNFSTQSGLYSKFRPGYPHKLFDFLLPLVPEQNVAWDCGTGNGQVALKLSRYFKEVFATDLSAVQIGNAFSKDNIYYSVQKAEQTSFEENKFDLITVAQAIHWFNFEEFYSEARKTLKPGGVIAVIGYGIFRINKRINLMIDNFYSVTTGPYWDAERKYIDAGYSTIPFPFKKIESPTFSMKYYWEFEQVIGFLNTWSAVQHYIKKNNENPVDKFADELKEAWGNVSKRKVTFPVFMITGRN